VIDFGVMSDFTLTITQGCVCRNCRKQLWWGLPVVCLGDWRWCVRCARQLELLDDAEPSWRFKQALREGLVGSKDVLMHT